MPGQVHTPCDLDSFPVSVVTCSLASQLAALRCSCALLCTVLTSGVVCVVQSTMQIQLQWCRWGIGRTKAWSMHSPGHCQVQGIASSLRVPRCMSARSAAQLWLPYWLASSQCSLPSLHMFMHGLQSTPLGNKGLNLVQVAASLFGTQQ